MRETISKAQKEQRHESIDEFTTGYIKEAIWPAFADPIDNLRCLHCLPEAEFQKLVKKGRTLQEEQGELIDELKRANYTQEEAGGYFWITGDLWRKRRSEYYRRKKRS